MGRFGLSFRKQSGGEGGIRTCERLARSASYRIHVARIAMNATRARNACPILPDETKSLPERLYRRTQYACSGASSNQKHGGGSNGNRPAMPLFRVSRVAVMIFHGTDRAC